MVDQFVAHHTAVHIAVLQIALLPCSFRRGDPAMKFQPLMFELNLKHMTDKSITTHGCNTLFSLNIGFGRTVLTNHLAVVTQVDRHIKAA